jgi:hypothetical protein
MKRALMALAAAFAAAPFSMAWACGACDEDKVAATYDHAVIDRAASAHHQVVFVAVDGPVDAARIGRRVATAASKVPGIVRGSLRTSLSPTAFSFALDAAQEAEVAVSGFRKAIGEPNARLTLVRIMRDGALVKPR